ncbi:MAG: GAF domain-containing protein [Planctomycetota bacterium]|jgi:GAF domain-containing protein
MTRKLERYGRIRDQIAELVEKTEDPIARRATAVALLHHKVPGVSWTGFYMLRNGELVVDVYQGPLACMVLARDTGVCWTGVARRESVVVPDVDAFPGHVPCDARTRSEIVVPHFDAAGRVIGVLDLDSHRPAHFDDEDREGLEGVVRRIETVP